MKVDMRWMQSLCQVGILRIASPFAIRVGDQWYVAATNGTVLVAVAVKERPPIRTDGPPVSGIISARCRTQHMPASALRRFAKHDGECRIGSLWFDRALIRRAVERLRGDARVGVQPLDLGGLLHLRGDGWRAAVMSLAYGAEDAPRLVLRRAA